MSLRNRIKAGVNAELPAFTIVELLVVIVVIGILAAITVVSYTGISNKASLASLTADLNSASKLLGLYNIEYDSYPTSLDGDYCPAAPQTDTRYCLKPSGNNSFTYYPNSTTSKAVDFALYVSRGNLNSRVNSTGAPTQALTKTCPYGFIVIPGSSTYGTSDFCVMKYEAKADDNDDGIGDTNRNTGYNTWPANTYPISATRKLVSTPQGYPVAYISQTTATTAASSYTNGCATGCHLITEAEWMTIAQNVLSNPVNWSGGAVGSGYIYSGHNDNAPATAIEAGPNDNDGYINTGNTTGSNQRRTLTLTNGEVIWDLAGNICEWTSGQTTGGQPGVSGETSFAWKEWTAVNAPGALTVSPFPSDIELSGAGAWSAAYGVGRLLSNASDSVFRGLYRGGYWANGSSAGVLALYLNLTPATAYYTLGFRVAQ